MSIRDGVRGVLTVGLAVVCVFATGFVVKALFGLATDGAVIVRHVPMLVDDGSLFLGCTVGAYIAIRLDAQQRLRLSIPVLAFPVAIIMSEGRAFLTYDASDFWAALAGWAVGALLVAARKKMRTPSDAGQYARRSP